MTASDLETLKYPIGQFSWNGAISGEQRLRWIQEIEEAPELLRKAVDGLSPQQLDTPYRPQGWTVRQVVHHLADSHMNSLVRFKLALTEEQPTIKPYDEARWAELADGSQADISLSLALLDQLHAPVGTPAPFIGGGTMGAHLHSSGIGRGPVGRQLGHLCLARASSYRSYYKPEDADELISLLCVSAAGKMSDQ